MLSKQITAEARPPAASEPRTCCRCGAGFPGFGLDRVCPDCRKPREKAPTIPGQPLTPRELQIVRLVQQAKLNKEIAYELHLTEGTIKEYLNHIYRKLGMTRGKVELALWAFVNLQIKVL